MAGSFTPWKALFIIIPIIAGVLLSQQVTRTIKVLGLLRTPRNSVLSQSSQVTALDDTIHCEDLHYHESSKLLFTACEENADIRYAWFPPLDNFDDASEATKSQGSIKIIDPMTLKVQKLKFENFDKQFITHGIDVLDDPDRTLGEAVYVFAVNHSPNPEYYVKGDSSAPKSKSGVEIFHYILGSDTIKHVRTIHHSLITTPNDILALSPTSFFVTNDHYYREGTMRFIEDLIHAKWTNTIHVQLDKIPDGGHVNDQEGIKASVALKNIHNNNGIGRGKTPEEILVVSCASGVLHLATSDIIDEGGHQTPRIKISESIELDSVIDNPAYFKDPYASETSDHSGYIVCGESRAIDLAKNIRDPQAKDGIMVWKVSPVAPAAGEHNQNSWNKTLIFEDDGSQIRTAATSVLVPLPGSKDSKHRRARLFVTGFMSNNIVAVDLDL